jgi:hypothetical protein
MMAITSNRSTKGAIDQSGGTYACVAGRLKAAAVVAPGAAGDAIAEADKPTAAMTAITPNFRNFLKKRVLTFSIHSR